MDKKEFLKAIAEILMTDEDDLKEEMELNSFSDFDSIAFLQIITLFEQELKLEIDLEAIRKLHTVKDLLKLGNFV
ncbi:acyl carrier protein [Campylobacter taeniopygiae]|uniref:Carrier domain-containing protein n=1 Tax=Campylobacter taeniopygiae TaxID=2510188 RepID=A0ABY2TJR0_9BACT|nr:acyl carrier protein [Campylobacter taeniopygiae]TKX34351.1 hypothetical protein CQA75_03100 [Campylobacter taeniopygiae]